MACLLLNFSSAVSHAIFSLVPGRLFGALVMRSVCSSLSIVATASEVALWALSLITVFMPFLSEVSPHLCKVILLSWVF